MKIKPAGNSVGFFHNCKERISAMPKNVVNIINYPTVADALKRVEEQKLNYEKNLLNKRFIYAFVGDNNQIDFKEVVFRKSSFLHLTGLDYKGIQSLKRQGVSIDSTEAFQFYERLGNDPSLINDVSFIQGNTADETQKYFRYTQHKLDNLSQLTQLSNKAEFIGKYAGNRDFDIIVNRNLSSLALYQDKKIFLPASLLFGKPQLVASDIKPIVAIFSRDSHSYKLEYLNAKINIGKKLFTSELLSKLNFGSFDNSEVKFNLSALDKLKRAFTASVRRSFIDKANVLSEKRQNAFENDTTLADYENERKSFIGSIRDKSEAEIAMDVLSEQNKISPNDLIKEEISEISEKFGLSAPALSTPTANKPMQMSISEDNNIPTKFTILNNGTVALASTPPPNDLFTQLANNLVKGLDNIVHRASTAIEKINQAVTKAVHSMTAQKSHSEARRASQSKNKGNSPKKKQVAKKAVSVAPAKRSEKQEQRSSVLGDITSARKELEKQHREAPTKEKHNNIEI